MSLSTGQRQTFAVFVAAAAAVADGVAFLGFQRWNLDTGRHVTLDIWGGGNRGGWILGVT